MTGDQWTDSKPANVLLCVLRRLIVVLAWAACLVLVVVVVNSCAQEEPVELACQVDNVGGKFSTTTAELEDREPVDLVRFWRPDPQGGFRFFLFPRGSVQACEEVTP